MPLTLSWQDIAIRLFFTVLGGALIGIDRGEHGRPAGLRTTLLVCLAASLSMIEANQLLATAGRASNSFVVLDLMRLPLGILSGMGFIGAGAILRKDNLVLGVTTAATLWFVTMMGLCFGGGQIGLGCTALALGLFTLEVLKRVERLWKAHRQGILTLHSEGPAPSEDEIARRLQGSGYRVVFWDRASYLDSGRLRELTCQVHWRSPDREKEKLPAFVRELAALPGIVKAEWKS